MGRPADAATRAIAQRAAVAPTVGAAKRSPGLPPHVAALAPTHVTAVVDPTHHRPDVRTHIKAHNAYGDQPADDAADVQAFGPAHRAGALLSSPYLAPI